MAYDKDADQTAADLHLCCLHFATGGFLKTGLISSYDFNEYFKALNKLKTKLVG